MEQFIAKDDLRGGGKCRLWAIDVMQGIAMLWVIVGHHLLDFMPSVYNRLHYYIYSFHMPYFIFISSFLIAYSYKKTPYMAYVLRKGQKFFIPYVLIGGLVIGLKAIQQGIDIVPKNIFFLIFSPKQSEATFLWYIYLLFFLYALYPFCWEGVRRFKIYFEFILLSIGFYFYLKPIPIQILCIDYFTKYFLFYVFGLIAAWHFLSLKKYLCPLKVIAFFCFIIFLILTMIVFLKPEIQLTYIMLCFVVIPAMYGLGNILSHIPKVTGMLVTISKNCFHIYLYHMFFIQGLALLFAKIYAHKIESLEIMFIYLIVSTILSIVGPILLSNNRLFRLNN